MQPSSFLLLKLLNHSPTLHLTKMAFTIFKLYA